MSNKKMSSIEWLQAIELERDLTLADWNKAKAMHKEEIEDAFDIGTSIYYDLNLPSNGEQYYNETYGGNND